MKPNVTIEGLDFDLIYDHIEKMLPKDREITFSGDMGSTNSGLKLEFSILDEPVSIILYPGITTEVVDNLIKYKVKSSINAKLEYYEALADSIGKELYHMNNPNEKTNKFRPGNIIWHKDLYHSILSVSNGYKFSKIKKEFLDSHPTITSVPIKQIKGKAYLVHHDNIDMIEPVPITDEILLKSGFEKVEDVGSYDFYWKGKHIDLTLKYELSIPTREYDSIGFGAPKKYIHELQNLILDLTDEEWEVNL